MKAYNLFEGSIEDQLHRIGRRLLKVETNTPKKIGELSEEIEDINDLIGDEETADTILYRLKALEDAG